MDWSLIALFSSFAFAFFLGLNHWFQVNKWTLTVWANLIFTPVLLITAYLYGLPTSSTFYGLAVVSAGCYILADLGFFQSSAKYGGAIAGPVLASRIWLTFFIWMLIDQAHAIELMNQPLKLSGIILTMAVAVASLFLMKRAQPTREAFIMLFPAILVLTLVALIQKYVTFYANPMQTMLVFTSLVGTIAGVVSLVIAPKEHKFPATQQIWLFCITIGFFGFATAALRLGAMIGTPNPAYVIAISLLGSTWLNLFDVWRQKFSWHVNGAAMLYLASIVGLVVLSS